MRAATSVAFDSTRASLFRYWWNHSMRVCGHSLATAARNPALRCCFRCAPCGCRCVAAWRRRAVRSLPCRAAYKVRPLCKWCRLSLSRSRPSTGSPLPSLPYRCSSPFLSSVRAVCRRWRNGLRRARPRPKRDFPDTSFRIAWDRAGASAPAVRTSAGPARAARPVGAGRRSWAGPV